MPVDINKLMICYPNRDMWKYEDGVIFNEIWNNDIDYENYKNKICQILNSYSDFEFFVLGKLPGYAQSLNAQNQPLNSELYRSIFVLKENSLINNELNIEIIENISENNDLTSCFIKFLSQNYHLLNTGALVNINMQSGNNGKFTDSIGYIKTNNMYNKQLNALKKYFSDDEIISMFESFAVTLFNVFEAVKGYCPNINDAKDIEFIFHDILRASQFGKLALNISEEIQNLVLDCINSCYEDKCNIQGYLQGVLKGNFATINAVSEHSKVKLKSEVRNVQYTSLSKNIYDTCLPYRNMWKIFSVNTQDEYYIYEKYLNYDNYTNFKAEMLSIVNSDYKVEICSAAKIRLDNNSHFYHGLIILSGKEIPDCNIINDTIPEMNTTHIAGSSNNQGYYFIKSPYFVNLKMDGVNSSLAAIETSRHMAREVNYIEMMNQSSEKVLFNMFKDYGATLIGIIRELGISDDHIQPLYCSTLNLILTKVLKANHQFFSNIHYKCSKCTNGEEREHDISLPIKIEYYHDTSPFSFVGFFKTPSPHFPGSDDQGRRMIQAEVLKGYLRNLIDTTFDPLGNPIGITDSYQLVDNRIVVTMIIDYR